MLPVACALSLAALASPASADDGAGGASQRADALAAEATKAVERGDLESARTLFAQSAALKPSYDTTGNLGAVELALKHYRDCAEHLGQSLRDYPPTGSDSLRKTTLEKFAECRQKVASARLELSPAGTAVTLDGGAIGKAPFAEPLFVAPGKHVLAFTREGHEPSERTIEAVAGAEFTVRAALTPKASLPQAPIWPLLAGGIGSAVFLSAGVGAYLASSSTEKDGDTMKASLAATGKHCPADCAALIDTYESASSQRNAATGLFATAGVMAAGTAAYYLVFRPKLQPKDLAWVPLFDGQNAGLLVRSEF